MEFIGGLGGVYSLWMSIARFFFGNFTNYIDKIATIQSLYRIKNLDDDNLFESKKNFKKNKKKAN
jgi:hypothetical protein